MLISPECRDATCHIWGCLSRKQVGTQARPGKNTSIGKRATSRGTAMNRYALAAALAICLGSPAQAALIDLSTSNQAMARVQQPVRNLAVTQRQDVVAPPANMSELPEPEVFAMMLLGLILIGYKAGRDSSEKFK